MHSLLDQFKEKDEPTIRLIYEQYSNWTRHLHTLVWACSSFGIGIAIGGLTLFEKLDFVRFGIVGCACVLLLCYSHRLAESNRSQLMEHWKVLNAIEMHWALRRPENEKGPLADLATGHKEGLTQNARLALTKMCIFVWVIAVSVKAISEMNYNR